MRIGELLVESHGITGAKFVDFVRFCVERLGLESMPKIHLVDELEENNSFGVYYPNRDESHIAVAGRHPIDVMRTVAHELVHARQRELKEELDGSTGSDDENEANAMAGVLMREFAPTLFGKRDEVSEMGVGSIAGVAQPMTAPVKKKKKSKTSENFADGKVKGKSRPGRAKRAGVDCSKSITDLRSIAKRSSGEKQKMAHWCANMKSGRKKS
jgi:hypothetical protein